MFGEYESESPRVPSPWDSLISSPGSLSPSKLSCHSNGNLSTEPLSTSVSPRHLSPSPLLLPRLVPENDSGNVEYKLQLLNPSPARFARLVTQLKWRLLEGGGQAYYELGVADSGDLVGLGRENLESSLDTLEMMAGEIGASVIVVKEIEVPAELAAKYEEDSCNNGQCNSWGDARGKRSKRRERDLMSPSPDDGDSASTSACTSIEAEGDLTATGDGDYEDMQMTVILKKPTTQDPMADLTEAMAVFAMDSELESDSAETADTSELDEDRLSLPPPQYAIDLEISSVYKPRPMRKRFHHTHQYHHVNGHGRSGGKRGKKVKEKPLIQQTSPSSKDGSSALANKSLTRRQARDRRREERKQALLAMVAHEAVNASNGNTPELNGAIHVPDLVSADTVEDVQVEAKTLGEELEGLHVGIGSATTIPRVSESIATSLNSADTDSTITAARAETNEALTTTEVFDTTHSNGWHGTDESEDDGEVLVTPVVVRPRFEETEGRKIDAKLIVEVLVVRKMSIEEGFLDFEGFSFV
ncbi:hypothetical protein D9756_007335 [Leucocoprinus leucothites]|uniref:GTP-binding protein 2 n=1 Tax=Leucocoprinus leucothites TaxID=201217 RepID=A0A8H5FZ56_9AGAR|nr:hypothetical protein D9756_007335 [Leucoagaricus leucothites]